MYEKLRDKYSDLVATILAYNLNSKGLFALGDVDRQSGEYTQDLADRLFIDEDKIAGYLENNNKSSLTIEDVIYGANNFVRGVTSFRQQVDQNIHHVSMTRREDYVEFRGLGGKKAFDSLRLPDFVRKLCVISASQALGNIKTDYTERELYKILKPYMKGIPEVAHIFQTQSKETEGASGLLGIINYLKDKPNLRKTASRMSDMTFSKMFREYLGTVRPNSLEFKKLMVRFPIDTIYMLLSYTRDFKDLLGTISGDKFPLDKMLEVLDREGSSDSRLFGNIMEALTKLKIVTLTDKQQLDVVDRLKGVSGILKYLPNVGLNTLVYLFGSDNANDRFNAYQYLELNNKLNLIPKEELLKFWDTLYEKGQWLSFRDGAKKILTPEEYLTRYPKALQDRLLLSEPDVLTYVLDNYDKYKNMGLPFTGVIVWLANDALKDEVAEKNFIRLTVLKPELLSQIDYISREVQLEIVKQRPDAILSIKSPYKATLNKVRELGGKDADKWIETAATDFGYRDVMDGLL